MSGRDGDKPKDAPESDAESGFLSRWSRRKAAARSERAATPEAAADPAVAPAGEATEPPFDPASLPPVDGLTAESDFSVFMGKQVPEALRNAALKKLWRTEPSVLDYQPLVDYAWDFTAPGYGALKPTDDVLRMVRQVFEGSGSVPPEEKPETEQQVASLSSEAPEPELQALPPKLEEKAEAPSKPKSSIPETSPPRRRHGGALPD